MRLAPKFSQTATVAVVAIGAALGSTLASATPVHSARTEVALGFREPGANAHTSGGPLIDHGGTVLSASHTYAIWWGDPSRWDSDVMPGIATFFSGLDGSAFLNTASQYMRGASIGSMYRGSAIDSSTPPKKVTPAVLGQEVAKFFGSSLDPAGVYFVYTSTFPKGGNFCAWHSSTMVAGQSVAVAYMPNTSGINGCDPGNLYGLSGSEGLRSLVNVTSHVFMEAITDPLPTRTTFGWIDASGAEIGDKCAWTFASPVTLGGTQWQLQMEWSNSASGCVQTTP